MSRVGKQPVVIPSGVQVAVKGQGIEVQGPRGKLVYNAPAGIVVKVDAGSVLVSPERNDLQSKANYGTTRAIVNNMVKGVTEGWKKALELHGVGFNAKLEGKSLVLSTGYSHDVTLTVPDGVDCKVSKTTVDLESTDKELVGTFAAKIKKVCPPEPYLGKGIRYSGEKIRRKAGKTGKK